jgi:hypothetical protein
MLIVRERVGLFGLQDLHSSSALSSVIDSAEREFLTMSTLSIQEFGEAISFNLSSVHCPPVHEIKKN